MLLLLILVSLLLNVMLLMVVWLLLLPLTVMSVLVIQQCSSRCVKFYLYCLARMIGGVTTGNTRIRMMMNRMILVILVLVWIGINVVVCYRPHPILSDDNVIIITRHHGA